MPQKHSAGADVGWLVKNPHSTPSKILSQDLDSRVGRKLVYRGDGYLIAELAEGSRQHLSTFFLFSGTDVVALLDKSAIHQCLDERDLPDPRRRLHPLRCHPAARRGPQERPQGPPVLGSPGRAIGRVRHQHGRDRRRRMRNTPATGWPPFLPCYSTIGAGQALTVSVRCDCAVLVTVMGAQIRHVLVPAGRPRLKPHSAGVCRWAAPSACSALAAHQRHRGRIHCSGWPVCNPNRVTAAPIRRRGSARCAPPCERADLPAAQQPSAVRGTAARSG